MGGASGELGRSVIFIGSLFSRLCGGQVCWDHHSLNIICCSLGGN